MNKLNSLTSKIIYGLIIFTVITSSIILIINSKYDAAGGVTACSKFDPAFPNKVNEQGASIFYGARDAFIAQKPQLSAVADNAVDYARSRPAYVKLLNEWLNGNQTDDQASKIYAAYKAGIDEYFGLDTIKTKIDVILEAPRAIAKSKTDAFSYAGLDNYCGEGTFSSTDSQLDYRQNWQLVTDRPVGANFKASIDVTALVIGSNQGYYDSINSTFGSFATKISELGNWYNDRLTFKNGDKIILRATISIKGIKDFGASYKIKFNL
ncbi:hypothetical protein HY844_01985 [Candidatus Berkelbacteria bacterium]|nr:hypothetical protein [Candidatus Berkelbacteria bacterium]